MTPVRFPYRMFWTNAEQPHTRARAWLDGIRQTSTPPAPATAGELPAFLARRREARKGSHFVRL
jgi:hypothetical protein